MEMTPAFKVYTAIWISFLALGLVQFSRTAQKQVLLQKDYYRFLFQPWKVITFLISGTTITFIGPWTTDPTWDWVDGGVMSLLTYLTAPWAVGALYRSFFQGEGFAAVLPAAGAWLFS